MTKMRRARSDEHQTGAGATIGVTLLREKPGWTGVGVDCSAEAAQTARKNAEALGVGEQLEIHVGDLFAPVEAGKVELVVSNPPAVCTTSMPP